MYHLNDTDKYTLATFAPNDWDGLVAYADRCLDDRLRLRRTILRIEHVSIIGSPDRISDYIVHIVGWRVEETVCVRLHLGFSVKEGDHILARVYLKAETPEDLIVLPPFELAPEPDPNDGLA